MFNFKKLLAKYLKDAAEKIDSNDCELTEEEMLDIARVVAHESMSKEQACRYLGDMSRRKFDYLVKDGTIPKGRKVTGYKELRWYKDELDISKQCIN